MQSTMSRFSSSTTASHSSASNSAAKECSICYAPTKPKRLIHAGPCQHDFCHPCLTQHVRTKISSGAVLISCPMCFEPVDQDVVARLAGAEALSTLRLNQRQQDYERALAEECSSEYFENVARVEHLRRCPHCGVVIQRSGRASASGRESGGSEVAGASGGDSVITCACGMCFLWTQAPTVVPCNKVHVRGGGLNRILGSTCPGCTRGATVRLVLYRMAMSVLAPPLVIAAVASRAAHHSLVPRKIQGTHQGSPQLPQSGENESPEETPDFSAEEIVPAPNSAMSP